MILFVVDSCGWPLNETQVKVGWTSVRYLNRQAVAEACRWYVEKRTGKFQCDMLADITKRARELDYPDSDIIEDGVHKRLLCVTGGKPVYLSDEEYKRREEPYLRLSGPSTKEQKRTIRGMVADTWKEIGKFVKGTSAPAKDQKSAAEQIEQLKRWQKTKMATMAAPTPDAGTDTQTQGDAK